MTRIAVIGAAGRMGREICRASLETEGIELIGGTVKPGAPELGSDLGELCGSGKTGVLATEDPPESAEVLIEFTTPGATVQHLSYERPHIIGTTGLSEKQLEKIEEASHSVPIVHAPNMSIGVNLLREIVRELSAKLGEGYDIEVVEAHHKNKKDAPSGTALFLARAAAEGRHRNLDEVAVYGREGAVPRREGEIGIHALRGGAVVGEHRLIFYSGGEEVEVIHRALSRRTFADGALRAARFVANAPPGLYSMADVLEDRPGENTTDASAVPLIPREVLFGNPEKVGPRLSPDGKRLAYLAPKDGVMNVWVGPVEGEDFEPVTDDRKRGIRVYFWAEDNTNIVYLQDEGGDENWRVHAVDASTKEDRDLTPFDDVQAQIVDKSRHFPDTLLVALNRENPELHDVYRLTLSTGDLDLVAKNPGSVVDWVVDPHLRLRGAMAATPEGGFDLLLREGADEDAHWRKLLGWRKEDALSSGPVDFTEDGEKMYLLDSRGANASHLVLLDLESGATQTLVEDPRYDVGRVVTHPETHEAQAAAVERARTEWVVLDDEIREDFEVIGGLDRGDFGVASRDRADENWLVAFTADEGGASYYAYDRKSRLGEHLFDARPGLAEYTLARMEPVSFASRDGFTIEGYLTLPPGGFAGPMPMVLNVHGGPWVRDGWGYDPEAQWFANRGYACLQVNYRGSTGYGKAFLNAGNKEWGGRMHDDLVDAVGWAVERGVADPERVAIYGGSYGGYAALVGATFTPDLFRCAVDIVGPSSLITLINSIPPYWKPLLSTFHERVGNPETEEDFLKSRSPLFFVDRIKIPMLIAQGANDPRVKQAESEQIVAAMKEKGIDYEYLLFEDEGHGFARPENRLKFYAAAERFLAKHLGGRAEE